MGVIQKESLPVAKRPDKMVMWTRKIIFGKIKVIIMLCILDI